MFFTYLSRELRRRSKQAIVVAIGLAIGIGLVITVSAASAGVKTAQGKVLHSLYGVGTDMTVTKAASIAGAEHFGHFGSGGFPGGAGTRPSAGTHFSRNALRPSFGEATLPASDVTRVASVNGVAEATGGLALTDTSLSGTVPSASSGGFNPGAAFTVSTFTVDGIQITASQVGPLTSSQIVKGSYFSSSQNSSDVAIVSTTYANQHKLAVGSTITVGSKKMSIIGLASTTSGAAEVYLPLGTAQNLAGLKGDVTTIYVAAVSSGDVSKVATTIQKALPKATVTTSASLASEVTGSLANAANLASNLGRWLSWTALVVAFLVAGLLMAAAVSRRVREFGTLKAIGWRTRRVVGQVMGEGLTLGLTGGLVGILFGLGGAGIVSAVSPALTAVVGAPTSTGAGSFTGGSPFGGGSFPGANGAARPGSLFGRSNAAAHTLLVHLTAPLQTNTVLLAVGLAIVGGLVAGAFGAWRAARLRPAAALRSVE